MKKNYFLAGAMLLGASSFGQLSNNLPAERNLAVSVASRAEMNQDRAPGDIIGSVMDFSDAAAWAIDNAGVTGAGWTIGAAAPTGPFTAGTDPIASTSGPNFAMFQADGSVGTGTVGMVNSIDLTAYSNVAFEFESFYRPFNGTASVEFSIDSMTWTSFEVHEFLALNENSDNSELISINITDLAAGEATVWARFKYESTDDYFWMVDDAKFVEGFNNQLIIGQNYISEGEAALEYYMIPTSQLAPVTFGARVSNNGTVDQTNTTLNVKVNDGSSDIYDENSDAVTSLAFGNDSLAVITEFNYPGEGTYTIAYNVSSADFTDEADVDNSFTTQPISVGGDIYGRDNGISSGSIGFFGSTPVLTICTNVFEFFGDYSFGSVDVQLAAGAGVGESIFIDVRKWNGVDEYEVVTTSADYSVQTGDGGSMVRVLLDEIIDCEEGDIYEIGVGHYGSETIRIVTAQVSTFGSVVYNDGARTSQNSVFVLRTVQEYVGLDEDLGVNGISVYPNPSVDRTNLTYRLLNDAEVNLTVTDLSGKVVLAENFGSQEAGTYNQSIGTENMAEGVYFYTLNVGGKQITNKLVVASK